MSRFEPIVRSWSAISRSLPQFAPARRPHARRRPMLECLESRSLLSTVTLTVNSLADAPSSPGVTTLRGASPRRTPIRPTPTSSNSLLMALST